MYGYGSDIGWMFQNFVIEVVKWGYVVYVVDMFGYGCFDGICGYILDVEKVQQYF